MYYGLPMTLTRLKGECHPLHADRMVCAVVSFLLARSHIGKKPGLVKGAWNG